MRDGQLQPIVGLITTREGLLRLFGTVLLAVFATLLMLAAQALI